MFHLYIVYSIRYTVLFTSILTEYSMKWPILYLKIAKKRPKMLSKHACFDVIIIIRNGESFMYLFCCRSCATIFWCWTCSAGLYTSLLSGFRCISFFFVFEIPTFDAGTIVEPDLGVLGAAVWTISSSDGYSTLKINSDYVLLCKILKISKFYC